MNDPLSMAFHGFPPTEWLASLIEEQAEKLERYFPRIISCRVVVEQPHRHHRHGKQFNVRISVGVPGKEVVVARSPAHHVDNEEVHEAVLDAFRIARRRLQDYARTLRGEVKAHTLPAA